MTDKEKILNHKFNLLKNEFRFHKGYAERYSEIISEKSSEINILLQERSKYNHFVRNLGALVDSIRYTPFDEKLSTDRVLDEVVQLIADLEKRVGEIS